VCVRVRVYVSAVSIIIIIIINWVKREDLENSSGPLRVLYLRGLW